jgi:DinB superfamily
MLETYLEMLEEGYYEVKFAFEGLADENVWKRPAEGLLSIGEIAGHIAYWEATRLAGERDGEEHQMAKCYITSPLIDHRFAYYPDTMETTPSVEHLEMTSEQVCDELLRVHKEAVAYFKAQNPDLDARPPGVPENYTYRAFLSYLVFHIGYHTGQMFSVRHLLGDKTPDN